MRGRASHRDYDWPRVEADLANGVHPAVVAARLGESMEYVLDVADAQGWPVAWEENHPVVHADLGELDS
jgi:hypothetical protein